jgi:hypothetical protein
MPLPHEDLPITDDDLSDPRNPMSTAFVFYSAVIAEVSPDEQSLPPAVHSGVAGGVGCFSEVRE